MSIGDLDSILKVVRGILKVRGGDSNLIADVNNNANNIPSLNTISEVIGISTTDNQFAIQAALGNISDFRVDTFLAKRSNISGNGPEVVRNFGGTIELPTSAEVFNIASSNSKDVLGDTGANTIIVQGLDASYNEISELVNLNGTTNVPTANSYLRIHKLAVVAVGSDIYNRGRITAISQTSSIQLAEIAANENVSASSFYTVPAGKTALLSSARATVLPDGTSGQKQAVFALWKRELNGTRLLVAEEGVDSNAGASVISPNFPVVFPEKTDIWVEAQARSNNTKVTLIAQYGVIDNA